MYTDDPHYTVFSTHGYVTADRKRFGFKFDNYVSRPIRFTPSRHGHCNSSCSSRKTTFSITRVHSETVSYGNENVHCSYRIKRGSIHDCSLDFVILPNVLMRDYLTFGLFIDCSNDIKRQNTFLKYRQYTLGYVFKYKHVQFEFV